MDIPALSMAMAQMDVQSDVGVALLSKSIDLSKELGDGLVKIMESSVTPFLGGNIDISL